METKLIYRKISEVMSSVEAIGKDRKNTVQGYSFRGIDDMYNALNEHLAKAKIFFASEIISKEREERETAKGGNLIYTILRIKWTIYAEDGSSVTTETVGEAMDSGDKSANKAMSAAYKYALMQVFCIPTDDPKDTENETHEVKPKNEKECVICSKRFVPPPQYPYSTTCSALCTKKKKEGEQREEPIEIPL